MKHKVIFWAAASVLAVLAACNKPSGLEPQISISAKDPVEAPATEYSYSFKLTATVDWEIRGLDEDEKSWLEVSPVSGAGSSYPQTVTVDIKANTSAAERSATFEFYGSGLSAPLTIVQAGTAETEIYSVSFLDGQGGFTVEDKDKPAAIDEIWKHDPKYGMVATAYKSDTQENFASESWLVSPVIDLTAESAAYLSFKHAVNFFKDASVLPDEAAVWAREENGTWERLEGVYYPPTMSWTFMDSGSLDLGAYVGRKMQFAFVYSSTAEKAGTWEIQEVSVTRNDTGLPEELTPDTPGLWLELPALDDAGSGLCFISHDMPLGGKDVRNYSYCYSTGDRLALWVAYPLNDGLRGNGGRSDEWSLDPKMPRKYQPILYRSYTDRDENDENIYNRGHQIPSADRLDAEANLKTFYFTNSAPQSGSFNSGVWADLENMVRDWSSDMDTLYVVTGVDIAGATEVAHDNEGNEVTVPTGFYKALLGYDKDASFGAETGGYIGIAFYFEHRDYSGGSSAVMEQSMSIDALEDMLGYDFFVNLPAKIGEDGAAAVESAVDSWWN